MKSLSIGILLAFNLILNFALAGKPRNDACKGDNLVDQVADVIEARALSSKKISLRISTPQDQAGIGGVYFDVSKSGELRKRRGELLPGWDSSHVSGVVQDHFEQEIVITTKNSKWNDYVLMPGQKYFLIVRTSDKCGNMAYSEQMISVQMPEKEEDQEAPLASNIKRENVPSYGFHYIKLDAIDNIAVDRVEFHLDGKLHSVSWWGQEVDYMYPEGMELFNNNLGNAFHYYRPFEQEGATYYTVIRNGIKYQDLKIVVIDVNENKTEIFPNL